MSSSATFSHSRLSLGFPATNTAPCLPPFNAASRWDKSSFPFKSNPLWHSRQCRISNGATSRSKIAAAKEWPPVDPSKDRINPDKIVRNPRRCIKERCLEKLPEECERAKRKPSLSKQKKLFWRTEPRETAIGKEVAEREGFEPSIGVNLYSLSRGALSTTQPSLRTGRAAWPSARPGSSCHWPANRSSCGAGSICLSFSRSTLCRET